ncbi:hypothetical protein RJJ65_19470 [Rhizobium hidalgonense]|uniref:Uncharacterized protein n=1 Tax=Rhizobium hidalgonense TaxID=1538159 RepID=A0AAJ2LJZ0_9HYPH|nr:hypothetical protein [Rhizobium hidalgonense]
MPTLLEELTAGAAVLALPVSASLVTPVSAGAAGSVAASSNGSGPSTVRSDMEEGVWKTVAADTVFVDGSCAPPSAAGDGIADDDAVDDCMSPDDIRDDVSVPVKEDWTVALA